MAFRRPLQAALVVAYLLVGTHGVASPPSSDLAGSTAVDPCSLQDHVAPGGEEPALRQMVAENGELGVAAGTDGCQLYFSSDAGEGPARLQLDFSAGVTSWDAAWLALDPDGTAPEGAYLRTDTHGSIEGGPEQLLSTTMVVNNGGELLVLTSFALGDTKEEVSVWHDGELIATIVNDGAPIIVQGLKWPMDWHKKDSGDEPCACDPGHSHVLGSRLTWTGFRNSEKSIVPSPPAIIRVGSQTFQGDTLDIMPILEGPHPQVSLARVDLSFSGLQGIQFTNNRAA